LLAARDDQWQRTFRVVDPDARWHKLHSQFCIGDVMTDATFLIDAEQDFTIC